MHFMVVVYRKAFTIVLTGRKQYSKVFKSIQKVSTVIVSLHILMTVLQIFKVPMSAALCILIIMLILSFGRFNFSRFNFSVFAPVVITTVANLYPLCSLCSSRVDK